MMACVVKRESFFVYVPMVYLFKSIYIQKLTALLLSQAVAQSDEKKSIVGEVWWAYFSPTIAFSSFLMVFAVSPLHVDAFAKK